MHTPMIGTQLSFTPAMTQPRQQLHQQLLNLSNIGVGGGSASLLHAPTSVPPLSFVTPSTNHRQPQHTQFQLNSSTISEMGVNQLPIDATPIGRAHNNLNLETPNHNQPLQQHHQQQQPFSTTPSIAVPLAFATPAQRTSSYVQSNPLFSVTGGGSAASATRSFAHLPPFAAHSSLPFGLGKDVGGVIGGHVASSSSAPSGVSPSSSSDVRFHVPREPIKALIRSSLARGHFAGAMFYADKLATLDSYSDSSVLTLADTYSQAKHYSRAVYLLKKYGLMKLPDRRSLYLQTTTTTSNEKEGSNVSTYEMSELRLKALYIGLQCLLEMKSYEEAIACCVAQNDAATTTSTSSSSSSHNTSTLSSTSASSSSLFDTPCSTTEEMLNHILPRDSSSSSSSSPSDELQDADVRDILGQNEILLVDTLVRVKLAKEKHQATTTSSSDDSIHELDLCASIAYIRGQLYELQSQKYHSIFWYRFCLYLDPRHYEAWCRLTSKRLLGQTEEVALTSCLQFSEGEEWIGHVWRNKIQGERSEEEMEERKVEGKQQQQQPSSSPTSHVDPLHLLVTPKSTSSSSGNPHDPSTSIVPNPSSPSPSPPTSLLSRYRLLCSYGFGSNSDLLCSLILSKYQQGYYRVAYDLSKRIMMNDPYFLDVIPTYVCTLVELGETSELYAYAHKLNAAYPSHPYSWFTIGCYYYLLKKYDLARKSFYKSTRLDLHFLPGWIGFGHTFSSTDESDQALLAYRTAHRLFPGSNLPMNCIGMEYLKTNNYVLAQQFFQTSIRMNCYDPLAHNELGIIAYKNGLYEDAVQHFQTCLSKVTSKDVYENWEATLFNLGHALRKCKQYQHAITAYNRALSVTTRPATVLTAIGFTYHLQGEFDQAIDYYHKALGMNPRDTFTIDMLDRALKEVFEEGGF